MDKPNLTQEQVSKLQALAAYLDGLSAPRFDMMVLEHPCGTPACAKGHAWEHFGYPWVTDLSIDSMGYPAWSAMFSAMLGHRIKTPQEWATHCRAKLKEWGYPESACASSTAEPEVRKAEAHADPFRVFMSRTLEPVDV